MIAKHVKNNRPDPGARILVGKFLPKRFISTLKACVVASTKVDRAWVGELTGNDDYFEWVIALPFSKRLAPAQVERKWAKMSSNLDGGIFVYHG